MFLFIINMKIALNQIPVINNFSLNKKTFTVNNTVSFRGLKEIPDFASLKPFTNTEKERLAELKEIENLTLENGVFSLDKAAELLKSKIDKQQMLYSENDIKAVVSKVIKANPEATREEILKVLMKLSSFSNYESLSKIEDFCNRNKIYDIRETKELSINNILLYLKRSKDFIRLPKMSDDNLNTVIFADRETINLFKKQKNEDTTYFNNIKDYIKNGNIKLVILDGFEAKTKYGLKSFNFAGGWGDLAEAANAVLKSQKEGKNPFVDDIKNDLKKLFGENIKINVVNNDCENIDEKIIAERLNPKTISKDYIKKIFNGISKYSASILKTEYYNKNNIKLLDKEIQPALIKAFYPVVEIYSPRRIAKEMKELHKKIGKKLDKLGKNFDDVVFLTPDKEKSFGLISYQYAKVNNTDNLIVYPNYKDMNVDRDKTRGKVFLFLDDFSGSGQSFFKKDLPYLKFKKRYPANSIIFAPVAYTNEALKEAKESISDIQNRKYPDIFVGNTKIGDLKPYLALLPSPQDYAIKFAKKNGYNAGANVIAFPHVIPDNCPDIAGMLLKKLLKSDCANKATMDFMKECRINALSAIK